MNINLAQGMNEIIIREGAAPKVLDPKAPVKMNINGTIGAPVEFLKKRINAGQFEQKNCHIIVDRENITIELVVNESDEYTRGTIKGTLQFHPKFIEFGINTGKVWSPFDFSMFCKMNRAFFADKNVNMTLVSACKNFTATVNNAIERSIKENGPNGQFRPSGQFQLAGIVHAFNPCFQGWQQGELGGGNIRQD